MRTLKEVDKMKAGIELVFKGLTSRDGRLIVPEPFYHGLIPYLWLKYVKKKDVHFIGWRG